MLAILLAASLSLPPGVVGEWEGVDPDQKAVIYSTGIQVTTGRNPDHPEGTFGFIGYFKSATSNPRAFVATCGHQCNADVIFMDDGSLEIRTHFVDIDTSVISETYRFTRPDLSGS